MLDTECPGPDRLLTKPKGPWTATLWGNTQVQSYRFLPLKIHFFSEMQKLWQTTETERVKQPVFQFDNISYYNNSIRVDIRAWMNSFRTPQLVKGACNELYICTVSKSTIQYPQQFMLDLMDRVFCEAFITCFSPTLFLPIISSRFHGSSPGISPTKVTWITEEQGIKYLQGFHSCAQRFQPLYTLFLDDALFPGIWSIPGWSIVCFKNQFLGLLGFWSPDGNFYLFPSSEAENVSWFNESTGKSNFKMHAILRDRVDLPQF